MRWKVGTSMMVVAMLALAFALVITSRRCAFLEENHELAQERERLWMKMVAWHEGRYERARREIERLTTENHRLLGYPELRLPPITPSSPSPEHPRSD